VWGGVNIRGGGGDGWGREVGVGIVKRWRGETRSGVGRQLSELIGGKAG